MIATVWSFESRPRTRPKYSSTCFLSSEAVPGYHVPATTGSWIRADGVSAALNPSGYRNIRTKTAKKGKNRQELLNLPDMALPPALSVRKGRINLGTDTVNF